jgi:hypothetical protein
LLSAISAQTENAKILERAPPSAELLFRHLIATTRLFECDHSAGHCRHDRGFAASHPPCVRGWQFGHRWNFMCVGIRVICPNIGPFLISRWSAVIMSTLGDRDHGVRQVRAWRDASGGFSEGSIRQRFRHSLRMWYSAPPIILHTVCAPRFACRSARYPPPKYSALSRG